MVWRLLYVLGKLSFFHFWGTTFFHCSVVPVLIIFPGVSSVGDESVSFLPRCFVDLKEFSYWG